MSKLFKLKNWLTLADAAKYLTSVFEEEVTEADVLQLTLDGHLRLSVYFHREACAERYNKISLDKYNLFEDVNTLTYECHAQNNENALIEATYENIDGEPFTAKYRCVVGNCEAWQQTGEYINVIGMWDLPLLFNEAALIKNIYYASINHYSIPKPDGYYGISIADSDGCIFGLSERICDSARGHLKYHTPANDLPEDSIFVIRTATLREFEQSVNDTPAVTEKPIITTERNSLLTVIAALCDYSAIKHQERGAAAQLVNMTQEIGAAVSDDTIRKILKQIPDALESRTK